MRDRRFVALHRGGELTPTDHRLLMVWALACTYHVRTWTSLEFRPSLLQALHTAQEWIDGKATTGDAMKASRAVHAEAKGIGDPIEQLLARCVGQAVATAHMADHCLGPAWYAIKIVREVGGSVDVERAWQLEQLSFLPPHLVTLVSTAPKFTGNRSMPVSTD
ncbi:MAG TPA: hypothetical protein DHV69_09760 [Sphaerochaeta sp.]|nr:hypothetical protein [Sphaerochaeta sp.]